MRRGQEDKIALAATQIAVATDDPDFVALATQIRELRAPGRLGPRPLWVRESLGWSDPELAAAILWRVIRARLWAQEDEGEEERGEDRELPYLSTVGTDLGTDLLARYDPQTRQFDLDPDAIARGLPITVGVQLLGIAASVGLIVITPPVGRSGHRVTLADRPFAKLQGLINGASKHVRKLVTIVPPTTNVTVRKPPELLEARPTPPLRVLMATDKVQRTSWRINRRVLEALEGVQAQGTTDEQIANIIGGGEYLRRRMVLAEARELAREESFFWRGFLEFRGRFFQRSGSLSYTSGDDSARGLLEFANGEKLDIRSDGFGWIAWHAAQMWGHGEDKTVPFGYGIPWLAKIVGDVDLDDTSWLPQAAKNCVQRWQEADNPAQFLAAALALEDACAGLPVHLPVRVDATCSGMQHLALLLRDEEVARLVNLWGPADVSAVLLVTDDPKPDFYDQVAKTIHGLTQGKERRETKAVIVPLLYGAKKTLAPKLATERRGESARVRETDKRDAKAIVNTAKTLAPREFKLLDWFAGVAEAHNAAGPLRKGSDQVKGVPVCWITPEGAWYSKLAPAGVPVRWTTPSGFQVIQDYRRVERNPERLRRWSGRRLDLTYSTTDYSIDPKGRPVKSRIALVKRIYSDWLDKKQQRTSILSSVVHSMDAALLVEIVAGSSIEGWAVAHDAFAVPPGRVRDLLRANQDAIRTLYTADRLAEWAAAWRAAGVEVPDPPEHEPELPREMWSDLRTLS